MAETSTRITKLSALNIQALKETHRDALASGNLTLGKTWAEWQVSAHAAIANLDGLMSGLATKGHPRASLHAVRRKLTTEYNVQRQAALDAPLTEEEIREYEVTPDNNLVPIDTAPPKTEEVGPMDPAADFLLDLAWSNLFESAGKPGAFGPFRCKGCGATLPGTRREGHFKSHKENRKMSTTETKPAKPKAPTAKDQGVPAEYLGANGNFKPGMDARLKSDLVCAILGVENKKALASFTPAQAQKLIDARSWQGFVDTKKRVLTAKGEKAKKAADAKAERVRLAAETKKAGKANATEGKQTLAAAAAADGDEVVPDPKPESKKTTSSK